VLIADLIPEWTQFEVTILIGERHALAGDTRFVEFVDDAATRLGRLIDAAAGGQGDGRGYLTARAYFGALIAFVLLQDQLGLASIRAVDATEYIHHLAQLTVRGTGLARKTAAGGSWQLGNARIETPPATRTGRDSPDACEPPNRPGCRTRFSAPPRHEDARHIRPRPGGLSVFCRSTAEPMQNRAFCIAQKPWPKRAATPNRSDLGAAPFGVS
jgi:hypothetical protein